VFIAAETRKLQPKKVLKKKSARNISNPRKNNVSNDSAAVAACKARAKRPKGKIGKRKTRKTIRINGLDLLHNQTLLSTSPQG